VISEKKIVCLFGNRTPVFNGVDEQQEVDDQHKTVHADGVEEILHAAKSTARSNEVNNFMIFR
jgi:hypothetical protein